MLIPSQRMVRAPGGNHKCLYSDQSDSRRHRGPFGHAVEVSLKSPSPRRTASLCCKWPASTNSRKFPSKTSWRPTSSALLQQHCPQRHSWRLGALDGEELPPLYRRYRRDRLGKTLAGGRERGRRLVGKDGAKDVWNVIIEGDVEGEHRVL